MHDDDNLGYPLLTVRVFKNSDGEEDKEKQKLLNKYLNNWQTETEAFCGRMGIKAKIPDFFDSINKGCPKFTEKEIEHINSYITKYKVIPFVLNASGGFIPEEFLQYTKQVWWLVPFVIWKNDTASWIFIDKNGFKAAHPGDNDGTAIHSWDSIDSMDLEWVEDNLVSLTLYQKEGDGYLDFFEFIDNGCGSYLSVIENLYNIYKKTIKASEGAHCWYHGAGGEGYHGFDSVKELLNEKIWMKVKPTDPSFYGYSGEVENDN